MNCKALTLIAVVLAAAGLVRASDSIPGAPQRKPIAIVGGTIHTVSGPVIEGGVLVFDKGRIVTVGKEVAVPTGAEVIDAKGKHIYPGLMAACTDVGLMEVESVRATRDSQETGMFNPNVRAERAVNPDSEMITTTRANGVLLTIAAPEGGAVSGLGACLRLDGWTWEQMTVRGATGLHVNWPNLSRGEGRRRGPGGPGGGGEGEQAEDPLRALRKFFADARAYQAGRAAGTAVFDSKWEAMLDVVAGKVPLVVNAEAADQIASAVAFCVREKLKLVINGGYDADQVAPLLKEHGVGVIIAGVQRSPRRRMDAYDAPFTLASRLRDAGVKFAIAADRGAAYVRNLPYHAATASAFGLTREEALRAITLSPAELFGVSDQVGSLETGKEATLFIADGDILDTPTQVIAAWTQGRTVDLASHHTRLWKKYETKYDQQKP